MLAIRLQRTGRKGHAQYRVVVQDSSRTPTSGRIVANIGHYDPHTKDTVIKKDKAEYYLGNGAQPSPRAAGILKKEGVKLPKWVVVPEPQKRDIRHPEKLRRNQPKAEPVKEETPVEPTAEKQTEAVSEAPAENPAE